MTDASSTPLLHEIRDSVAYITLNNPTKMNALTPEMDKGLFDVLSEYDENPDCKVMVIRGAGKNFSAGYDIGTLDPKQPDKMGIIDPLGQEIDDYIGFWFDWDRTAVDNQMKLWHLSKPVITSVQGYVLGGGFWYTLASDLTIAAENTIFGQPEVRHVSNTTFLFAAIAGWKNANRYSLTGDPFDAGEAYRMGIVNNVVPLEELDSATEHLAQRLASVPLASLKYNKAIAMRGLEAAGIGAGMSLNAVYSAFAHSAHGPDRESLLEAQRKGGMRAFLKERDGAFYPEPYGPRSKPKN